MKAALSQESISPVDYLSQRYFWRWLHSLQTRLLKYGLVTEEELRNPEGRLAQSVDGFQAVRADEVAARRTGRSKRMQVDVPPNFQVSQDVRVKNEHPRGHTQTSPLRPRAVGARCKLITECFPFRIRWPMDWETQAPTLLLRQDLLRPNFGGVEPTPRTLSTWISLTIIWKRLPSRPLSWDRVGKQPGCQNRSD